MIMPMLHQLLCQFAPNRPRCGYSLYHTFLQRLYAAAACPCMSSPNQVMQMLLQELSAKLPSEHSLQPPTAGPARHTCVCMHGV